MSRSSAKLKTDGCNDDIKDAESSRKKVHLLTVIKSDDDDDDASFTIISLL